MFDAVMVLGLDEAEDVPNGGADAGEHQGGHHDGCEDHGLYPIGPDGRRAPLEKPSASWVLRQVSSAPPRRDALLGRKLTARSGTREEHDPPRRRQSPTPSVISNLRLNF